MLTCRPQTTLILSRCDTHTFSACRDSDGGHDLIGEFVCTLRDLVEAPKASRQFPLIRDKKVGRKGYSNSGLFMVASATVTHVPTFLEYIQGGCGACACRDGGRAA